MKLHPRLAPLCLGLLLLPGPTFAQRGAPSAPIQVRVGEVTDFRSISRDTNSTPTARGPRVLRATPQNPYCQVELIFTGGAAQDAGAVRQVQVTVATDDRGTNLILPATTNNADLLWMNNSGQHNGALRTQVKLHNPARDATLIKIIKGQAEFFSPTATNGGRLTLPDVLKHPGEDNQNPALIKYGIQLRIFPRGDAAVGYQPADDIDDAFLRRWVNNNNENSITTYIKDPDHRLISLKFTDGGGRPLQEQSSSSSNGFRNCNLVSPPPADTQLVIELAVPAALKSYPFTVENIPLP